MATPSGRRAMYRNAELGKTEQSFTPQSSPRAAPEPRAAPARGGLAQPAAGASGVAGYDLNGAGEAQAALDVESTFGPFLDELVAATIQLSDAGRQIGRQRRGGWRRFRWALGERLWRLESKIARSQP